MHIVRKLAHFCEYMLEGFLLMLCLRVYTRHRCGICLPMLGGVLTALTDETIQLFVPGRSGQVTDIWMDFSGVMTGLLVGLILWACGCASFSINIETRFDAMTIEQANAYFAALPDGFAPARQLQEALSARGRRVEFWA